MWVPACILCELANTGFGRWGWGKLLLWDHLSSWPKVSQSGINPAKGDIPILVYTWEASAQGLTRNKEIFKWTLFPVTSKADSFLGNTHLGLIKLLWWTSEQRLPLSQSSIWSLILLLTHFCRAHNSLSPTGVTLCRFCINMLRAEFISAKSPVHLNFPKSFGPHYW